MEYRPEVFLKVILWVYISGLMNEDLDSVVELPGI